MKIEFFVINILDDEIKWEESYKNFNIKEKEELKSLCEEDGIEKNSSTH